MRTIVLWDIDNTLLYTGGAGSLGMARAFEELYGVPDAFRSVEFSGRTDTAIFRDCARANGIAEDALPSEQQRFLDAYVPHLATALAEVEGKLMPGVRDVLDALTERDDVVQGLGTGNFRAGGQLKLTYYEIDSYFPEFVGGFGEDAELRAEVVGRGIERLSGAQRNGARVVVIGDTPHDVTAALANDAFALGVATGKDSADVLRDAGADVALADLSDVARVVEIICRA